MVDLPDFAASFQWAIIDILTEKLMAAAEKIMGLIKWFYLEGLPPTQLFVIMCKNALMSEV